MTTGFYISAGAHALFVAFLLFGGIFSRDRLPEVSVADVTVLSEAEFAALTRPVAAPDVETDTAQPIVPETGTAPDVPAERAAPETPAPSVAEAPDAADEIPERPAPLPQPGAEIDDTAPEIIAPPSFDDSGTRITEGAPPPAPRVAPEAAPPPPPEAEAEEAPQVQQESAPRAEGETVAEERRQTAPPEAATEIVTEAEEADPAPEASIRPRSRPARPVQTAGAPDPAPRTPSTDDAVRAALEPRGTAAPAAPSGPPLTGGERDALRVSVQHCWNVGSLSTDALGTTVTLAVEMGRDGRPDAGSIRMIGFEGGSQSAAQQAYEAARRAIIRCGAAGFPLPVEKYDHWRDIEMTFNPEGMRFR